jgi:hypothetical protein
MRDDRIIAYAEVFPFFNIARVCAERAQNFVGQYF